MNTMIWLVGDASSLWTTVGPSVLVGGCAVLALVVFAYRSRRFGGFHDAEVEARGSSILLGNWIRNWFAWSMRPVDRLLQLSDIPPNAVTSVSVLLAIGAGVAVGLGRFSLGGCLYLFSGAMDFLDGRLARATGKASPSGAALDSILDRYSEAAMIIGLALYYRDTWVLLSLLLFLTGSFLVPYICARGEGLGIETKVGLMQRPERMVILGMATALSPILEAWFPSGSSHPFYGLTVTAICLMTVSTQFTSMHRLLHVIRALDARAAGGKRTNQGRGNAGFVALSSLAGLEFLLYVTLVNFSSIPTWLAMGLNCAAGSLLNFVIRRAADPRCPTSGGLAIESVGTLSLGAGGVAVLVLIPGLDYRTAFCIVRIGILLAWNLPLWRDQPALASTSLPVSPATREDLRGPHVPGVRARVER